MFLCKNVRFTKTFQEHSSVFFSRICRINVNVCCVFESDEDDEELTPPILPTIVRKPSYVNLQAVQENGDTGPIDSTKKLQTELRKNYSCLNFSE